MSCKWMLRIKRNNVYKARLVARGFEQKPGVDYFETYAPVISMSSLRLVLAIIIQKNLEIYALDVKTAFLNGDLQETIYMEQPMGYNDNSGRVCKLLKSLYGLKQAPTQWFKRFTDFIIHLNFQQLNCEACIFVRRSKSEIFIVLYVDDLLIAGSDDSEVGVVIQLLRNEFEMSKAEVENEFLGIGFVYSHNKLSLCQKAYVEKVLNKFRMADCKPSGTPLVPKSTSSDFVNSERFHGPYRELVGALLYLSMTTRPDILYSVNCLSQIQEQPTNSAWAGLKRILRYLKGTSELQLLFCKSDSDNIMINVYVDADWGADTYDRKSISGYIIFFIDCPVIWSVKKQTSIALYTTEAEILALAKTI
ncbi:Copia protein [Araneus ventricosus]|uniref:Copia protein n=1 Tax=Araneus ventricosus TaxID=182803 RepID=A0A4Y2A6E8_ARAVE|nr:Copia protein [Araneus ventricosus]